MFVLVACEESQAVCLAFRSLGCVAFSCDVLPCSAGYDQWHIQGDVRPLLNGNCTFFTCDGQQHYLPAVRMFPGGELDELRYSKMLLARQLFMDILTCSARFVAVENPVPLKIAQLPKYSQIVQPFQFGHPWRKRTCLWLRGLPCLAPTEIVEPKGLWVGATSSRRDGSVYSRYELRSKRSSIERSKTFPGIASAMAAQWVPVVLGQ